MKIAYFTSIYPRASDSFIRAEVALLRERGFIIDTFSVRKPDFSHLTSEIIRKEYESTTYLLENYLNIFFSFFFFLFFRPRAFFQGAYLAVKTCSPGIKTHLRQVAYFIEACALAKILQEKKIDHLHNHIAEASATVAMLASKISGIPFSLSIHGPGIFYNPQKWALKEKIRESLFTRCISQFCKSQCMAFSDVTDWKKLHVVHCILEPLFLSSAPPLPIEESSKLLAVGRLEPLKGFLFLIEVLEKLLKEGVAWELTLIGDGPMRREIEEAIAEKSLVKSIKLLGWADAEIVKKQMIQSRAIISSSFNEGLPVVLIEALSLGRPVLAPSLSGIPELIISGENGYLYTPGSHLELAEAIKNVLQNPTNDLMEMGKRGVEIVKKKFNREKEIAKLENLFRGQA